MSTVVAYYDGLDSPPVQLGADLNRRPYPDDTDPLGWDAQPALDSPGEPQIAMCAHAGDLCCAWLEYDVVGGVDKARGPYVSRWDGSAWVALGGEVEPALLPWDLTDGHNSVSNKPTGARTIPARLHLVSDGTTLYVVYSIHVTEANPYATGSQWESRRVVVRAWDGTGWPVLWQATPVANNATGVGALGAEPGHYAVDDVYASSGEACVYVTYTEAGVTGNSLAYPWRYYTASVRVPSSGSPTVKVVNNYTAATYGSAVLDQWWVVQAVRNNRGVPYYWAAYIDNTVPSQVQHVRHWVTDADVVASLPPEGHTQYRNAYYVPDAGNLVGEYADSFTLPPSNTLDGMSAIPAGPGNGAVSGPWVPHQLQVESNGNIWGQFQRDNNSSHRFNYGKVWLYHRHCRAWHLLGQDLDEWDVNGDGSLIRSASLRYQHYPTVLLGDSVYVASTFTDNDQVAETVLWRAVRVYRYPIHRDLYSCTEPYVPPPPPAVPVVVYSAELRRLRR